MNEKEAVTRIKEIASGLNKPLAEIKSIYSDDFNRLFNEEKPWLCNIEEKTDSFKKAGVKEDVDLVIAKLKESHYYFSANDIEILSKFTSNINIIVRIVNRLNNYKQGTILPGGIALDLPELFNQIKKAGSYNEITISFPQHLKSLLPHLFSVVKHCQDPLNYPVYYRYWKNIIREVIGKPDDYESFCSYYRGFPAENRHLLFGTYFLTIGLQIVNKISEEDLVSSKEGQAYKYLKEDLLNVGRYEKYLDGLFSPNTRYFIFGSKYGGNKDMFPEMLQKSVIANGFAFTYDLSPYYLEDADDLEEFLKEIGEPNNSIKALKPFLSLKSGDQIAIKADGSPKGDKGFLSIVGICEVVEKDGKVYEHDPDGLGQTIHVNFIKAPVYKEFEIGGYGRTIQQVTNKEHIDAIFNSDYELRELPALPGKPKIAPMELNTILYGPPGTGKTYCTIEKAIHIINEKRQAHEKFVFPAEPDSPEGRKLIKEEYDKLVKAGKIVFTTFHQSMSYEDFIEGIKPKVIGNTVVYEIQDGIFKDVCNKARFISGNFTPVLEKFKLDISEEDGKPPVTIKATTTSFDVIYRGTNVIYVQPHNTTKENPWYPVNIDNIRKAFETNIYEGIYNPTYVREIIEHLKKKYALIRSNKTQDEEQENYVLIIDEINRGNVSQVFGELITLIEVDKREGNEEQLEIKLPYSKQQFSVPNNLYILGTMNTADRSVEALDSALRRRFSFQHMPPKSALLKTAIGDVNLNDLLDTINKRIVYLSDQDHQIGHSYLMKVNNEGELKETFKNKIIPLLKEYFYNDFDKIRLILGEGFVEKDNERPVYAVNDHQELPKDNFTIKPINDEFNIIEAIKQAIGKN